jgi:hypothetical protein
MNYELEFGPSGMTISREGLLEWKVPGHMGPAAITESVRVGDSAGELFLHRFGVSLDDAEPLVRIATGPHRASVRMRPTAPTAGSSPFSRLRNCSSGTFPAAR